MCLGVPGQVLAVEPNSLGVPMGRVSFAGITKEVCLAYTPEVAVGDYVIVHVGFAISKIDEAEAQKVFEYLREIGELEGIAEPGEARTPPDTPPGAPPGTPPGTDA